QELTSDELAKLDIQPTLEGPGFPTGWNRVEAEVYNGLPDINVSEITIEITVVSQKKDPIITARPYRLVSLLGGEARALQTGNYETRLGFFILPGQSWSFRVAGAKGTKN